MCYGYLSSFLARKNRIVDGPLKAFVRKRQIERLIKKAPNSRQLSGPDD